MTADVVRPLPEVTPETEFFWTGGQEGELRIQRCNSCGYWVNPPGPVCPECLGKDLAPAVTSGRATVESYTINYQQWYPALEVPYTIAIVELPEQVGLRLMTNIVNCPVEQVRIGMPVQVTFLEVEDVWVPLFEPVEA